MRYIGIDGCKSGWCVCMVGNDGTIDFRVFSRLVDLNNIACEKMRVWIDMPKGIGDEQMRRNVDYQLISMLKPVRHHSVFIPPFREAIAQSTYNAAKDVQRVITGKAISIQAWNIVPKIREVDDFIQKNKRYESCFDESHPEFCFYKLNGGNHLKYPKKLTEGQEERLEILSRYHGGVNEVFKTCMQTHKRKDVKADDIIDAICLAISCFVSKGKGAYLINNPLIDSKGIAMRIAYPSLPNS